MTNYRDRGVVLRTYKLGEADRIVVLLTENHGKVRAVAKGVRKTTSKIGARLEPMNHVDVLLHRGRDLDTVSQVDLLSASLDLRSNLDVLTSGMALLEGADHMTQDREPCPQTYRMLLGALATLGDGASPVLVAAFYWKLLASEGLSPQLDRCVMCDTTDHLVAFDLGHGGVQCTACRTGVGLSSGALALLRQILGGQLVAALTAEESSATSEVTALATRAMEFHNERRLRSSAMFEHRRTSSS